MVAEQAPHHCRQKLAELLRRVRRKTRRRPDPPRGLTEVHLLAAEKLSARLHRAETLWRITAQEGSYSVGALSALADAVDRQGTIPREWRRRPDCCPEGMRLAERRQREAARAEDHRKIQELERRLPGLRYDRRTGLWRARGWGGAVLLALALGLPGCGAPGRPVDLSSRGAVVAASGPSRPQRRHRLRSANLRPRCGCVELEVGGWW